MFTPMGRIYVILKRSTTYPGQGGAGNRCLQDAAGAHVSSVGARAFRSPRPRGRSIMVQFGGSRHRTGERVNRQAASGETTDHNAVTPANSMPYAQHATIPPPCNFPLTRRHTFTGDNILHVKLLRCAVVQSLPHLAVGERLQKTVYRRSFKGERLQKTV